jgi:hypothetical protein
MQVRKIEENLILQNGGSECFQNFVVVLNDQLFQGDVALQVFLLASVIKSIDSQLNCYGWFGVIPSTEQEKATFFNCFKLVILKDFRP